MTTTEARELLDEALGLIERLVSVVEGLTEYDVPLPANIIVLLQQRATLDAVFNLVPEDRSFTKQELRAEYVKERERGADVPEVVDGPDLDEEEIELLTLVTGFRERCRRAVLLEVGRGA